MLTAWLTKEFSELALEKTRAGVAQAFKSLAATLANGAHDLHGALASHLELIDRWSSEVKLGDPDSTKTTTSIYVHLDCYLRPRYQTYSPSAKKATTIPLLEVFDIADRHVIVLGLPGAGKTTSMKFICQSLLSQDERLTTKFICPVLVRFRDLYADSSPSLDAGGSAETKRRLVPYLLSIFQFSVELSGEIKSKKRLTELQEQLEIKAVVTFLDQIKALLVLEGFDEIPSAEERSRAIHEIQDLLRHLGIARAVITNRTGEPLPIIEGTRIFEISLLTKNQISDFSTKWLVSKQQATGFLRQLKKSPFEDTAIKPLTLAHLCAIFEKEGAIPEKPKTVYRKVVDLGLEQWSHQNMVRRSSKYGGFSPDRKREYLARLAWELTIGFRSSVFTGDNLISVYRRICVDFDLPEREAERVAQEIESHTGLLIQSGSGRFEFSHKSLQEFLTAEYIVLLPVIPSEKDVYQLPNEAAIAVAISSNPSLYFRELVFRRLLKKTVPVDFLHTFLGRLFQEKPEFNRDITVLLALVALYSTYLSGASSVGAGAVQLQLFYVDRLLGEFERILKAAMKRNRSDLLNDWYVEQPFQETIDGDALVTLDRKSSAPEMYMNCIVPKYLLLREIFHRKITLPRRAREKSGSDKAGESGSRVIP